MLRYLSPIAVFGQVSSQKVFVSKAVYYAFHGENYRPLCKIRGRAFSIATLEAYHSSPVQKRATK